MVPTLILFCFPAGGADAYTSSTVDAGSKVATLTDGDTSTCENFALDTDLNRFLVDLGTGFTLSQATVTYTS